MPKKKPAPSRPVVPTPPVAKETGKKDNQGAVQESPHSGPVTPTPAVARDKKKPPGKKKSRGS